MVILACAALLTLVVGCLGLGRLLRPAIGLTQTACLPALPLLGMGCLVWLTLVLNVAGAFSTGLLLAAIWLGVVLAAIPLVRSRPRLPGTPTLLALVVVMLPILVLVFIPPEINANDDGPAYLLFTEKLARLGGSGAEPFSERRLYGFGGQFGLVATIRDLFGTRWLSLYEPGLGLALIGAWLLLMRATSPMSRVVAASVIFGVAVVWLTITAKPIANLAPAVLYAAFLFGAVQAWLNCASDSPGRTGWFRVLAIVCAMALTLRPTAAPFIALLAVSAALPVIARRDWGSLAVAAGLAGVILVPAMLGSMQASQTLFYPFLGSGVHAETVTAPASWVETVSMSARAIWTWTLLVLSSVVWVWLRRSDQVPAGGLGLLGIAAAAVVLMAAPTGGLALDRYAFPILFAVFAALTSRLELSPGTSSRVLVLARPALSLTTVGCIGVLVFAALPPARAAIERHAPAALALRWRQPALDPAIGSAYRLTQRQIPAGTTLLAVHLAHADQLDVKRNVVLAADQAATAGPGPGWPQQTAPGALAAYLSASGVDYVAVSDAVFDRLEGEESAWQRRLRASRLLARRQFSGATADVEPVAKGPDFAVYAVADLR